MGRMGRDKQEKQRKAKYTKQLGDSMTTLPGYYTTAEAAEALGYRDTSSLRYACINQKVPGAIKVGKTWFLPASWVDEQKNIEPIGKGNRGVTRK